MKRVLRTGLTLAVVAAICTAAVTATYVWTDEKIAANRRAFLESRLVPALGDVSFDTGLTDDVITLAPPHGLPGTVPAQIYRVYRDGEPAAALFAVSAMNGYAGPIRILVGVTAGGIVSGVRVAEHNETPGLGDKIEIARSDWVLQFPGRSLGDPPEGAWRIRADGGAFDQITGATITPRAVIGAVRDTLLYFDAHRDTIFAPAGPTP